MDLQYFIDKCEGLTKVNYNLSKEEENAIYSLLYTNKISFSYVYDSILGKTIHLTKINGTTLKPLANGYVLFVDKKDYLQWVLKYKLDKI